MDRPLLTTDSMKDGWMDGTAGCVREGGVEEERK